MKVFGKTIVRLGEPIESLPDFFNIIHEKLRIDPDCKLLFRGEHRDYGETALQPQIFRNESWIQNEDVMLNNYIAKFPEAFPKGTSTFDIIVNADHYSLPSRVLDASYSPLTGLYMACNPDSTDKKGGDPIVYIFELPKNDIYNWNSDTVALLANVARMKGNFNVTNPNHDSMSALIHAIREEKYDYYNLYEGREHEYTKILNQIICVESKMLNRRINNQKGLFFLFGINGTKQNFKELSFKDSVRISSIAIKEEKKEEILKELTVYGYDKMTMFPEMENVCEAIKDTYKPIGKEKSDEKKDEIISLISKLSVNAEMALLDWLKAKLEINANTSTK
ncbi:MAG: FRG domain-containing protein [Bacteroidales bacterium]|nr:FRG domain-containing protein [Bacteroidales bacterium]